MSPLEHGDFNTKETLTSQEEFSSETNLNEDEEASLEKRATLPNTAREEEYTDPLYGIETRAQLMEEFQRRDVPEEVITKIKKDLDSGWIEHTPVESTELVRAVEQVINHERKNNEGEEGASFSEGSIDSDDERQEPEENPQEIRNALIEAIEDAEKGGRSGEVELLNEELDKMDQEEEGAKKAYFYKKRQKAIDEIVHKSRSRRSTSKKPHFTSPHQQHSEVMEKEEADSLQDVVTRVDLMEVLVERDDISQESLEKVKEDLERGEIDDPSLYDNDTLHALTRVIEREKAKKSGAQYTPNTSSREEHEEASSQQKEGEAHVLEGGFPEFHESISNREQLKAALFDIGTMATLVEGGEKVFTAHEVFEKVEHDLNKGVIEKTPPIGDLQNTVREIMDQEQEKENDSLEKDFQKESQEQGRERLLREIEAADEAGEGESIHGQSGSSSTLEGQKEIDTLQPHEEAQLEGYHNTLVSGVSSPKGFSDYAFAPEKNTSQEEPNAAFDDEGLDKSSQNSQEVLSDDVEPYNLVELEEDEEHKRGFGEVSDADQSAVSYDMQNEENGEGEVSQVSQENEANSNQTESSDDTSSQEAASPSHSEELREEKKARTEHLSFKEISERLKAFNTKELAKESSLELGEEEFEKIEEHLKDRAFTNPDLLQKIPEQIKYFETTEKELHEAEKDFDVLLDKQDELRDKIAHLTKARQSIKRSGGFTGKIKQTLGFFVPLEKLRQRADVGRFGKFLLRLNDEKRAQEHIPDVPGFDRQKQSRKEQLKRIDEEITRMTRDFQKAEEFRRARAETEGEMRKIRSTLFESVPVLHGMREASRFALEEELTEDSQETSEKSFEGTLTETLKEKIRAELKEALSNHDRETGRIELYSSLLGVVSENRDRKEGSNDYYEVKDPQNPNLKIERNETENYIKRALRSISEFGLDGDPQKREKQIAIKTLLLRMK